MISMFLRFVFTKICFYLVDCIEIKTKTQICNTNLGMLLRKGERKQQ